MTPAEQELAQFKIDQQRYVDDWARTHDYNFELSPAKLELVKQEYARKYAIEAAKNNSPAFQQELAKWQNGEIDPYKASYIGNLGDSTADTTDTQIRSDWIQGMSPFAGLFSQTAGIYAANKGLPQVDSSIVNKGTIQQTLADKAKWAKENSGKDSVGRLLSTAAQAAGAYMMGNALGGSTLFGGTGGPTSFFGVPAQGASIPVSASDLGNAPGLIDGSFQYTSAATPSAPSLFESAYPSMTDAAVNTAAGYGGAGASGMITPGIYTPSMTEAALTAAGMGATGSSLYPSLTNLANSTGGDVPSDNSWLDTAKSALSGGNTLSSLISGGAALYGANKTANAAEDAAAEAKRQFDIGQANAAPWLNAGKTALGSQLDLLGLPGGTGNSESSLAQLQKTPGYQFRLDQGRKNLEASSAARGGMGSGKSGVAMQKYGQDYGTNEYNNRLNQLSSLSGSGQVQANTSANAGQQYGTEAGNAALTAATARQSGILGAGSALSDWLNPKPKTPTLADLLKGGNYGY